MLFFLVIGPIVWHTYIKESESMKSALLMMGVKPGSTVDNRALVEDKYATMLKEMKGIEDNVVEEPVKPTDKVTKSEDVAVVQKQEA